MSDSLLHLHMAHACRLAVRGHGLAEPNPLVGCIILDENDSPVGWGYHRRAGCAHAEVMALERAGAAARGGTAIVTLEPCNHRGRTAPCSQALIAAGITRVIYACSDPHPAARGGAACLREAGVEVQQSCPVSDGAGNDAQEYAQRARDLIAPFLHRLQTGLPWVLAKWAHTSDGRMDRYSHNDRWISCASSRAFVHRERGRVGAIITGIGTVVADNPRLTARSLSRRQIARRVVWDPHLDLPSDCALLRGIEEAPLLVATNQLHDSHKRREAESLVRRGAELITVASGAAGLRQLLAHLSKQHAVATVMVESGPGLLLQLLQARLVNEALVFTSPRAASRLNVPPQSIRMAPDPSAHGLSRCVDSRKRGIDLVQRFRMPDPA